MRQPKAKTTVKWLHLVSPGGESFQGFWVLRNGHVIHPKPFDTARDAREWAKRNHV